MKSRCHLLLFAVVLLPVGAAGQGVQNKDISFLAGVTAVGEHAVGGGAATVEGYIAPCVSFRYGYQVARFSSASVWVEAAIGTFVLDSFAHGSLRGSTLNDIMAYTAGARIMAPVQRRVSVYGALGSGGGAFQHDGVSGGSDPSLTSYQTWHGLVELGGGLDYRVSERFSIRTEIRDLVSGRGLSGSAGRHHILSFVGFSTHW